MSQNHLASLSVEELQGYYSDFHKDFYGFRPRGIGTPEQWRDRAWLEENITAIHNVMDDMKETFAGREELRANGWAVEETDPEEAREAQFLADERARKEADMYADLDARVYGSVAQ